MKIMSYNIAYLATFHQTMQTLDDTIKELPENTDLILNSDQGWQYQMKLYQFCLKPKVIKQNMYRKGNYIDNAAMENFLGLLKPEYYICRSLNLSNTSPQKAGIIETE